MRRHMERGMNGRSIDLGKYRTGGTTGSAVILGPFLPHLACHRNAVLPGISLPDPGHSGAHQPALPGRLFVGMGRIDGADPGHLAVSVSSGRTPTYLESICCPLPPGANAWQGLAVGVNRPHCDRRLLLWTELDGPLVGFYACLCA